MRRRILFCAHPTVGHTNALVSIAQRLIREGDDVLFATFGGKEPSFRVKPEVIDVTLRLPSTIEARGVRVARLRPPLAGVWHAALLPFARGYAELRRAMALFTTDLAGVARDLLGVMQGFPADVIVSDFLFFGASLAAEVARVPCAVVYHSGLPFPVPGAPPFGSGIQGGAPRDARWDAALGELKRIDDYVDKRIADARSALGLPAAPPGIMSRPYSPDRNLLLTHPAIEQPRGDLGPRTVFVGPCIDARRDDACAFPWDRLQRDAFLVYVSLGTIFNNRPDVFAKILGGLDEPGVQVVVSAGASYDALCRRAPHRNAIVLRRVPQIALLPRVDLVLSHGGNNTTNETLAAGKPLLVVPIGGEQIANAHRVEALGAGLAVDLARLDEEGVRAAFRRLRGDASFARAARGIADALRDVDGIGAAAAAIRELGPRAVAQA